MRARDHVEGHIRSLGQQTLDALLRIEELLTELMGLPPAFITNASHQSVAPGAIVNVKKQQPKRK